MKSRKGIRIAAFILTVIMALGCVSALASGITKGEALKKARRMIPSTVRLNETEWDKDRQEWEFEFLTENGKAEYEVTVSGKSGLVKRVEMERKNAAKAKKYSITEKDAKKAVLTVFKEAKSRRMTIQKKTEDDSRIYKVTFMTDRYKVTVKVHGETGKIVEWRKEY